MKRLFFYFAALSAFAGSLAAAGDIWTERSPHRKRPQTRNPGHSYGSVAILPRGPQYGPASPARDTGGGPNLIEIQQMVQEQSGASPGGLVQKSTTNQDPCQGNPGLAALQIQVQDFMARAQALLAKLQAFNAEAVRLNNGINSCCTNFMNPSCVSCYNNWNSQIAAHNAKLPGLQAEVTALVAAAVALQGQYLALSSSAPCRSGLTQAAPAGQSLANFARRLGVRIPGGGSTSGSFGNFQLQEFSSLAGLTQGFGSDFDGNFSQMGVEMRPFEKIEFKLWKIDMRTIDFWKVNMRPFELEQGRFACLQLQAAALERARQGEEAKANAPKRGSTQAVDNEYHEPVAKKLGKDFDELVPQISGSVSSLQNQSLKISEPPPPQTSLPSPDSEAGEGMWNKAKDAGSKAVEWLKEKALDKGKEKGEEYAEEAAKGYLGDIRAEALKKIIKTEQNVFERVGQAFDTMGKMIKDPAGNWAGLQKEDDSNTSTFTGKWSEELGGPKAGFFGSGS